MSNEIDNESMNELESVFQEYVVKKIDVSKDVEKISDSVSCQIEEVYTRLKPLQLLGDISNSMETVNDFIDDNEDLEKNILKSNDKYFLEIKNYFESLKKEEQNNIDAIQSSIKKYVEEQKELSRLNHTSILDSIAKAENNLLSKYNELETEIQKLKISKKKNIINHIILYGGLLLQIAILVLLIVK